MGYPKFSGASALGGDLEPCQFMATAKRIPGQSTSILNLRGSGRPRKIEDTIGIEYHLPYLIGLFMSECIFHFSSLNFITYPSCLQSLFFLDAYFLLCPFFSSYSQVSPYFYLNNLLLLPASHSTLSLSRLFQRNYFLPTNSVLSVFIRSL